MPSASPHPTQKRSPSFAGEQVVFRGRLGYLSRTEAETLVRHLGGSVGRRVTRATTLLVVGGSAVVARRLAGSEPTGGPAPARPAPRVLTEGEFCERAGIPSSADLATRYHSLRAISARFPELRRDRIRYLETWGLVHPVHVTHAERFYTFDNLALLASVHERLERGASLRAIVNELMAERRGQLSLDFTPRTPGATVLLFPSPARPGEAEEWFRRGSELERKAGGEDAAAEAYSRALELDPELVPALINLANLFYLRNEPQHARDLYLRAAELGDEAFFQIPFNLGNIALDREDFGEARRLYERALQLAPDYGDAHFYLALALEKLGRSQEARPHWRAYRMLEPHGEWVRLAGEMERAD